MIEELNKKQKLGVNVVVCPNSAITHVTEAVRAQLKKLGMTGFLADEVQAPDPIMNLICSQVWSCLLAFAGGVCEQGVRGCIECKCCQ